MNLWRLLTDLALGLAKDDDERLTLLATDDEPLLPGSTASSLGKGQETAAPTTTPAPPRCPGCGLQLQPRQAQTVGHCRRFPACQADRR